eukprot:3076928-Alexandrium_andersonii.AAC.1
MKTRTEFVAEMVKKGKDQEWAIAEFTRRRNSRNWRSDNCPDTKLPRAQMYGDDEEEDYTDKRKIDELELQTKP